VTRAIDVLTLPFCIFVARSYGPSASFDVKDEMRQSEWNMSSATGRVRAATIAVKIPTATAITADSPAVTCPTSMGRNPLIKSCYDCQANHETPLSLELVFHAANCSYRVANALAEGRSTTRLGKLRNRPCMS
jgi:hypothetical protein